MTWVRSTRGRNSSISFLPNSRFMKRVGGDHADEPAEPGRLASATSATRKLEEPLDERHASEYLPVARRDSASR